MTTLEEAMLAGIIAIGLSTGFFGWIWVRRLRCFPPLDQLRRDFHWQRERLEAKLVQLADEQVKNEQGQNGISCSDRFDFDDDVAYVRNRYTGELSSLVTVTIRRQAESGPANPDPTSQAPLPRNRFASRADTFSLHGRLQVATAIFRHDGTRWETDGRIIFHLNPSETVRFYRHDLEMIEHEPAKTVRPRVSRLDS